jgi:hypothetical protein
MHALPPITDVRTTPRALRIPTLIALVLLAVWFVGCLRFALVTLGAAPPPGVLADAGDWFWLGRWRMFTDLRPFHTDLAVESRVGSAWIDVDLATWYPSRWDEGPGYLRDDFYENPGRLRRMAADLCVRLGSDPDRIRFTLVRWPKTLGSVEQPRDEATRTELLDVACGEARSGAGDRRAGPGPDQRGAR